MNIPVTEITYQMKIPCTLLNGYCAKTFDCGEKAVRLNELPEACPPGEICCANEGSRVFKPARLLDWGLPNGKVKQRSPVTKSTPAYEEPKTKPTKKPRKLSKPKPQPQPQPQRIRKPSKPAITKVITPKRSKPGSTKSLAPKKPMRIVKPKIAKPKSLPKKAKVVKPKTLKSKPKLFKPKPLKNAPKVRKSKTPKAVKPKNLKSRPKKKIPAIAKPKNKRPKFMKPKRSKTGSRIAARPTSFQQSVPIHAGFYENRKMIQAVGDDSYRRKLH